LPGGFCPLHENLINMVLAPFVTTVAYRVTD